jgi:hypothetical protein
MLASHESAAQKRGKRQHSQEQPGYFRKGCGCAVAFEPTAEPCEDKRACGLQEGPRLVQSERRLWCAAGGGTKHLGYHSAVQPPLPSCFARLLFLLHSSHAINLSRISLHTTYIKYQHAQGFPCQAVDLHFPSGPFLKRLAADQSLSPTIGHIVTSQRRKSHSHCAHTRNTFTHSYLGTMLTVACRVAVHHCHPAFSVARPLRYPYSAT